MIRTDFAGPTLYKLSNRERESIFGHFLMQLVKGSTPGTKTPDNKTETSERDLLRQRKNVYESGQMTEASKKRRKV